MHRCNAFCLVDFLQQQRRWMQLYTVSLLLLLLLLEQHCPTSNTLPRGEAPKPSTDTSSPVLPSKRLGTTTDMLLLLGLVGE